MCVCALTISWLLNGLFVDFICVNSGFALLLQPDNVNKQRETATPSRPKYVRSAARCVRSWRRTRLIGHVSFFGDDFCWVWFIMIWPTVGAPGIFPWWPQVRIPIFEEESLPSKGTITYPTKREKEHHGLKSASLKGIYVIVPRRGTGRCFQIFFYLHTDNWGRWTHFDYIIFLGLKPPK